MNSSEIEDIKITEEYSDLMVVGYKASEIAKNINVQKFSDQNEVSIRDFLEYSRTIVTPEKFLPNPLYMSSGQYLFTKYKGPEIFNKPLNAS